MARSRGPTRQPQRHDYLQVFVEQNPWNYSGSVPDVLARPVERPLAKSLWVRMQTNLPARFQIVLGPRRVGKSTAMYQTVKHLLGAGVPAAKVWWLRLDHPLLMSVDLGELVKTVMRSGAASDDAPVFLFVDELTYGDKWDLWLKTFFDEKWPIRLAGSSSATAALRERRMESGVGRWEEQYLAPYLFTEFLDLCGCPVPVPIEATLAATIGACLSSNVSLIGVGAQRRRFLLTGGFPELLVAETKEPSDEASLLLQSQRTLRTDAVERAIYKDIPQAFGVDDPLVLERLLYTLAGSVTGILSPSSICQTLGGLSQPTFDRYLAYLQQAFLVFTLSNYSGREIAKQRRGRKLYFVDGAVRNAALQRGLAPLRDRVEMGLLLENMVAGHLHALAEQTGVRLYHWRDGRDEVDLIYDHPEQPLAFEMASSPSHHRRGLTAFAQRFPRFWQRCYLVAPDVLPMCSGDSSDGIGSLPLDLLLLAIGGQAERELAARLTTPGA
jgi:hypothetical protein